MADATRGDPLRATGPGRWESIDGRWEIVQGHGGYTATDFRRHGSFFATDLEAVRSRIRLAR